MAKHTIRGKVEWDGTRTIDEDVVIYEGATLTLKPGTVIEVVGNTILFEVRGTLNAEGTPDELISFDGKYGRWGGIRFYGEDAGGTLRYCTLSDATIRCDASSPSICNSRFKLWGTGVWCENGASPRIDDNEFVYLGNRGLQVAVLVLDSAPFIRNNRFVNFDFGVQISRDTEQSLAVERNTMADGCCEVLDERSRAKLRVFKWLSSKDIGPIKSVSVDSTSSRDRVIITSSMGSYSLAYSDLDGFEMIKTDTCGVGPTGEWVWPDGMTKRAKIEITKDRLLEALCVNSVLSRFGRAGCADTPEDLVVLVDEGGVTPSVQWINDNPERGEFLLRTVDIDRDGAQELIVSQHGWCGGMGKIRLYEFKSKEGTR